MPKPNVREQILSTGLALLHGRGFNATSVQDITEAAGVPKGSFYNHFASKEALGLEVVQRYTEQDAGLLAVLQEAGVAPLARLKNYFRALMEVGTGMGPDCGCLLGNFSTELSAHSPLIRQRVNAAFDNWSATLAEVVAQAQADGSLADDIPAADLAAFLVNAWEGAAVRYKASAQPLALNIFMDVVLRKILR